MLLFPNAKINLGLCITEKRPDGYHNLESIFFPVPITDSLSVEPSDAGTAPSCHLTIEGIAIEGNLSDNLIVKAYNLFASQYPVPPVNVTLQKNIPTGAGLGGGSSDAAYMLRALRDMFAPQVDDDTLEHMAARLGADCAFFVRNTPVYATGIGNEFHRDITLPSLRGYTLAIVKPNVFVSTAAAYSHVRPHRPDVPVLEAIQRPVSEWKDCLVNDFEESVFPSFPAIDTVKQQLYSLGAIYSCMSGSGASVFALFPQPVQGLTEAFPDMFVHQAEI